MRLIKLKLLETWRTNSAGNVSYIGNYFELVVFDPKRDCFNLEAKPINWVCIHWVHGLRFLVDGDDLLMLVAIIICIVISIRTLYEVLNR